MTTQRLNWFATQVQEIHNLIKCLHTLDTAYDFPEPARTVINDIDYEVDSFFFFLEFLKDRELHENA